MKLSTFPTPSGASSAFEEEPAIDQQPPAFVRQQVFRAGDGTGAAEEVDAHGAPQCDISTGSVIHWSMDSVAPPITHSRALLWP